MARIDATRLMLSFVALSTAAACSLFADTGTLSGADDAGSSDAAAEAGTLDAAAADDAGVDGVDGEAAAPDSGPRNWLKNGDFEQGCAFWSTSYATAVTTSLAHGGASACLVCGTQDGFSFEQKLPPGAPSPVGMTFVGELWMRAAPDGGAPSGWVGEFESVVLRTQEADGGVTSFGTTQAPALTPTWQLVNVGATITSGDGLTMHVGVAGKIGECLIVDDATLVEQ